MSIYCWDWAVQDAGFQVLFFPAMKPEDQEKSGHQKTGGHEAAAAATQVRAMSPSAQHVTACPSLLLK